MNMLTVTYTQRGKEKSVELPSRQDAKVRRLEAELHSLPQVDLRTTHALSNGMYARTIFVPAGVALTGTVHKTNHINVCHGDISVTTDDGVMRLTGYHVMEVPAGHKRGGYAHADTYWTTICRTAFDDLADLEKIEDELVEESEKLQTRTLALTAGKNLKLEGE